MDARAGTGCGISETARCAYSVSTKGVRLTSIELQQLAIHSWACRSRDHERLTAGSPYLLLCLRPPQDLRCLFTSDLWRNYSIAAAWAQAQRPLGKFSLFHRVDPPAEYSTDSTCLFSLSDACSCLALDSLLWLSGLQRSILAHWGHLVALRSAKGLHAYMCSEAACRGLSSTLIPPRPALRCSPTPELSSCARGWSEATLPACVAGSPALLSFGPRR